MLMMIRPLAWWVISVPWTKTQSSRPMGIIEARMTPITVVKGMSRSVSGTSWPAWREREERSASVMPETMGRMIFSSVHTAATAIAPAPTKRTSEENVEATRSEMSPAAGSSPEVNLGSRMKKEMMRPTHRRYPR